MIRLRDLSFEEMPGTVVKSCDVHNPDLGVCTTVIPIAGSSLYFIEIKWLKGRTTTDFLDLVDCEVYDVSRY